MIVVLGATGHTGRLIVEQLAARGAPVRAVARDARRLDGLPPEVERRAGTLDDPAFLRAALEGAQAAYTLLPTDRRASDYRAAQDTQGEAQCAAVQAAGVARVVALSSLGADHAAGHGLLAGLHAQEQRLRALPGVRRLTLLRPASFFENLEDTFASILFEGTVADAVPADLRVPMVAARDIAAAAADALLDAAPAPRVEVRELLGPQDHTMVEVVQALGAAIGRPGLRYVQLDGAACERALVEQAGLSASFAGLYVEMVRAFGTALTAPHDEPAARRRSPTSLADVLPALAEAFRAFEKAQAAVA